MSALDDPLDPAPWLSRHLLPRPRTVQPGVGLSRRRAVLTSPSPDLRLQAALQRVNERLAHAFPLPAEQPLAVQFELGAAAPAGPVPQLEDDCSYRLEVREQGVSVQAVTHWGALAALATLTQYLSVQDQLHGLRVEDRPRFAWRGLLLDPARRFLPVPVLRRTIVAMAAFKLNTLHLHLTDDQGFRFPSERWPALRSEHCYARAELEELVQFAAAHGVRIVPELDVPGHVTAWLTAYPELGLEPVAPTARFGVHRAALNPAEPKVFSMLEDLLDELTAVFPERCVHLGGDEVHPQAWTEAASLQAFMARQALADTRELQAWFTERLARAVLARQRTPVFWDEALHERLTPFGAELIFMSWRGATWRDRILAQGHRCVVTAGSYLDLNYPAGWHYAYDPAAPQAQLLELEDTLLHQSAFRNVADGMRWTHQWRTGQLDCPAPTHEPLLLGAQACQWGELVDEQTLDQRLWSRLPALAELWWTPPAALLPQALPERLLLAQRFLEDTGMVNLAGQLQEQAQALGIDPHWQSLLPWLEPVKWYGRLLGEAALAARLAGSEMPQARPYNTATPLNRLVDLLPPESLATRQQFEALFDDEDLAATGLRYLLLQWQDLLSARAPALLAPHAAKLARLLKLLQREVDEGEPVRPREVEELLTATDDIQLAPAHALFEFLQRRKAP